MNAYETPKPTYAPPGMRRCESCGSLVADGKHCACGDKREWQWPPPVRVSRCKPCKTQPIERKQPTDEERKAFDEAVKRSMDGTSKKVTEKETRVRRKATDVLTCEKCGAEFPYPGTGRIARLCYECRKWR